MSIKPPATPEAFRPVPAHRRHLRHRPRPRAAASGHAIPTGATSARASPRPARCPARRRASTSCRSTPATRSTRLSLGCGSCARRSPRSTTGSSGAGCRRSTRPRTSRVSGGGRAALTRAAAALGNDQPRPLPAGLHRVRRAARHLPRVHADPDPARAASAATVLGARTCGARSSAAGSRRSSCRTRATRPASSSRGEELADWVAIGRELDCALLFDEFYSHYIWTGRPGALPVESAARYVEDVDRDPVVIFDGLTKNWRYPGLARDLDRRAEEGDRGVSPARARSSTAAARARCSARRSSCSTPTHVDGRDAARSTTAFRREARPMLLAACERLGVRFDRVPEGTFYAGATSARLPAPLEHGMGFFRAALEQKVITVRASSSTSIRASGARSRLAFPPTTCDFRSVPRRTRSSSRSNVSASWWPKPANDALNRTRRDAVERGTIMIRPLISVHRFTFALCTIAGCTIDSYSTHAETSAEASTGTHPARPAAHADRYYDNERLLCTAACMATAANTPRIMPSTTAHARTTQRQRPRARTRIRPRAPIQRARAAKARRPGSTPDANGSQHFAPRPVTRPTLHRTAITPRAQPVARA